MDRIDKEWGCRKEMGDAVIGIKQAEDIQVIKVTRLERRK